MKRTRRQLRRDASIVRRETFDWQYGKRGVELREGEKGGKKKKSDLFVPKHSRGGGGKKWGMKYTVRPGRVGKSVRCCDRRRPVMTAVSRYVAICTFPHCSTSVPNFVPCLAVMPLALDCAFFL